MHCQTAAAKTNIILFAIQSMCCVRSVPSAECILPWNMEHICIPSAPKYSPRIRNANISHARARRCCVCRLSKNLLLMGFSVLCLVCVVYVHIGGSDTHGASSKKTKRASLRHGKTRHLLFILAEIYVCQDV